MGTSRGIAGPGLAIGCEFHPGDDTPSLAYNTCTLVVQGFIAYHNPKTRAPCGKLGGVQKYNVFQGSSPLVYCYKRR